MLPKKQIIANFINPLIHILPLDNFLNSKRKIIILAYHGVEDLNLENYPLDIGCISATSEQFEYQLQFVKKNYNILTFNSLYNAYLRKGIFPEKGLIITFDDGYRNNYTKGFPLLKKYDIPATIFLSAGYIGTTKKLWFDELSFRIFNTKIQVLEFNWKQHFYSYEISDYHSKRKNYNEIAQFLKGLSNEDRVQLLDTIFDKVGVPDDGNDQRYMLNWYEILEMKDAGIEFGSHSVTHPILSKCSDDVAEKEIAESKLILERHLGDECLFFSYPNGGKDDFGEREVSILKRSGYKCAVSYIHSVVPFLSKEYFSLPRLHVELETTNSMFKVGCKLWPRLM